MSPINFIFVSFKNDYITFQNTSSCTHIHKEFHDCTFHTHNNDYYNLSALNSTETITDQERNLEFKFNICGPVLDQDAPCTKDVSVVMKNLSEPNIKYRYVLR